MKQTTRPYKPKQLSCENLPNRVRRYRLKLGLSLKALAEKLNVSPQAIREAETKGTGLSRAKWYAMADIFDVDPRVLETPDKNLEKISSISPEVLTNIK